MNNVDIDWLLIFENNMYFFLLSYTILGLGIKYIDVAYRKKIFRKEIALAFTPFISVLWAYTMLIDPYSATILFAILLGAFLRGKMNNHAFLIGFCIILIIIIPVGVELMIFPLIFLTSAAVLDELGIDLIDYRKKHRTDKRLRYQFVFYLIGRRYIMKIAILYLVLLNVFPWYFLLAIIFFDEAYIIMGMYSQSKQ